MEVVKIVVENNQDLTSHEKNLQMMKLVEKQLNTGPIIGEAKEVVLFLLRNLLVRDHIISALGLHDDKKESLFVFTEEYLDKNDKEILEKRKQNADTKKDAHTI